MAISHETPAIFSPQGSKIVVTRPDEDSCLFGLPGAGVRSSFLLYFSLQWIGLIIFSLVVIEGVWQAWPFLLAFGIMLIIGFGLLGWWVKNTFERIFVLLDRDRVVVKRDLFGWGRISETRLSPKSRADLVESHSQNDSPVYCVEISGTGKAARFGSFLSTDELNWMVDTINRFLGADQNPVETKQVELRETILTGRVPRCLKIEEPTSDCLRLRVPTAATAGAKIGALILGFTLGIIPVVVGFELHWWWPYYVIPGLLCLFLSALLTVGETIIELSEAQLLYLFRLGPLRLPKSFPTSDIIRFDAVLDDQRDKRIRREDVDQMDHNCVVTLSGKKKTFFLWMAKQYAATYLVALLQQRLNEIRNIEVQG